ncbi:DUF3465 domain-containing protein [Neptuniibacter sp. CAU 1671]|uniref:DUF3465 domain-containing protein n=1 Tax=Neptuniibacter sp. CAU 1671 TaxID=3032593 RepID=UPI0023DAC493|nr:DUF3465 domain-containing protein [Neptuniibacter sp. CAU 1671]MDF2181085.1 DUF3465 domain-containing protein [Neptuniibacter sp. CAU 1671]
MKKLIWILLLGAVLVGYLKQGHSLLPASPVATTGQQDEPFERAFREQISNLQLRGEGRVTRLLPDDTDGSRHQKFILQLTSGQTLLVSHNIDLAPRIPDLSPGDTVEFYGEYEWNAKGGVIHWTHHDPGNRHPDGWLKHRGTLYQ